MAQLNPKADEKTLQAMSARYPLGTEITVEGKKGKVIGYGLHSKMLIVAVGGDTIKVPMLKKK